MMIKEIISSKQARIILFLFCGLHLLFWTISSELARPTLPHDVLEGIAWGNQWQLGYHKHPFVAAWLVAIATKLGGVPGWPVYLLSQIAVVTLFISIYSLAKKIVSRSYALISVFLLEGILYYNINSINFTPDTAQTPFWGLCVLFFFNALMCGNFFSWFLVAVFASLSFLTKYQALFLFASMFFVLIFTRKGRISFKNKWFYFAIIIFFVLISPHLVWAYKNNFSGIDYMNSSWEGQKVSLFNHFYYPYRYIRGQLLVFAPCVILTWPFWKINIKALFSFFTLKKLKLLNPKNLRLMLKCKDCSKRIINNNDESISISSFNKAFVFIMGLSPILLTILYSVLSGKHIIQRWSTPYYYLIGLVVVVLVRPILNKTNFKRFIKSTIFALLLICVFRNSYFYWGPQITGRANSDVYLPNKEIANKVTKIWHENFNVKLKYIAGPHYLSAFISVYSKDKPTPYMSFSMKESPWVNEADLRKKGAIFVFEVDEAYINNNKEKTTGLLIFPEELKERFPDIKNMGVYRFKKKIIKNNETVDILVGILPPK